MWLWWVVVWLLAWGMPIWAQPTKTTAAISCSAGSTLTSIPVANWYDDAVLHMEMAVSQGWPPKQPACNVVPSFPSLDVEKDKAFGVKYTDYMGLLRFRDTVNIPAGRVAVKAALRLFVITIGSRDGRYLDVRHYSVPDTLTCADYAYDAVGEFAFIRDVSLYGNVPCCAVWVSFDIASPEKLKLDGHDGFRFWITGDAPTEHNEFLASSWESGNGNVAILDVCIARSQVPTVIQTVKPTAVPVATPIPANNQIQMSCNCQCVPK